MRREGALARPVRREGVGCDNLHLELVKSTLLFKMRRLPANSKAVVVWCCASGECCARGPQGGSRSGRTGGKMCGAQHREASHFQSNKRWQSPILWRRSAKGVDLAAGAPAWVVNSRALSRTHRAWSQWSRNGSRDEGGVNATT